jgi:hypothetical protein
LTARRSGSGFRRFAVVIAHVHVDADRKRVIRLRVSQVALEITEELSSLTTISTTPFAPYSATAISSIRCITLRRCSTGNSS